MASLSRADDDEMLAQINIIPFVDIILVVLTIFMLTSTAIVIFNVAADVAHALFDPRVSAT